MTRARRGHSVGEFAKKKVRGEYSERTKRMQVKVKAFAEEPESEGCCEVRGDAQNVKQATTDA